MALALGFADPVIDAQAVFRAAMDALARPAVPVPLASELAPPAPLTPELAAVALALADHETPVWLGPTLAASREVQDYLRFHTGARLTQDPAEAAFALVADGTRLPRLDSFAQGSEAYPDRSTTIVVAVSVLLPGHGPRLTGPGIESEARLSAGPLPETFWDEMRANRARFPRGVDVLLTAAGQIAGLPRSLRVSQEG